MNTKLLRQKILDLAIRGKLTDQRKSDGTARELLEQISAKESSSTSTLSSPRRRGSPSSSAAKTIIPLDKSEAPFEIPDNWEWVRLGDLCNASSGKTPSTSQKEFWNGNVLWVTSKDVKQKYIDSTQIYLSDLGAKSMQLYPPKTMIIVGRSGILRHSLPVAILKKEATVNQDLKALVFKDDRVVEFVYSVLKGMEQHLLHEYKKAGTTVDNLNFDLFLTAPIPLPPLAEQLRIVAKIEEAFAEIDAVEKNKELLKTHIKQTRQKILDLAIHGKLVPQDKNDEPAGVLLEKILQEKAQSDNKKSPKKKKTDNLATSDNRPYKKNDSLTAEDTPFEIPDSWVWTKLGDICNKLIDGDHNPPKGLSEKTDYLMLSSRNINNDTIVDLENARYLTKEIFDEENKRTELKNGDILFTSVGSLGRSCIYLEDENFCFQRSVSVIHTLIENRYLKYFFDSNYYQQVIIENATGTAQLGFYLEQMRNSYIAIPPLAEQKRIASKIESLFSVLDAMEKECN